ncbi:MAG: N-acetyltransferase [bacterium]
MSSSTIQIHPVVTDKERKVFVKFPYRLYQKHPCWVPPLLTAQKVLLHPEKHPFYEHADVQFFIAEKDGSPVGRIAAIVDKKHNKFHEEKTGFFGFFETEEEYEIAERLLSAAQDWITKQGMTRMRGPVNPSQNEDCCLLIDAFDSPPVIMMPYNPPFYNDFIERFGFLKAMDFYAYYIDNEHPPPEKLIRVAEAVRKRKKLTVRPINMKKYDEEIKKVWYVYNNAWSKNWGFVPMTEREFEHLAKNLKSVLVPEIALMAEIEGKPIGFSLSLPDLNRALIHTNGRLFPSGIFKILWHSRKIDFIRIIILGVVHEYQKMGIDAIFYLDTWRNAVKKGYWRGEMSWILENNEMMNRSARMLGGRIYKTYRMYEKNL